MDLCFCVRLTKQTVCVFFCWPLPGRMKKNEERQGIALAFHAGSVGIFHALVEDYAFHRMRGFAPELLNDTPNLGGFSAGNRDRPPSGGRRRGMHRQDTDCNKLAPVIEYKIG